MPSRLIRSLRRSLPVLGLVAATGWLPACTDASERGEAAPARAAGVSGNASGSRGPSASGRGGVTLAARDVAQARRANVEESTPITGTLEPLERVTVRARIEGDLLTVHAREGQVVRAGQLLARFDDSEQESLRRSAEADVASAQSELANAEWRQEQARELFREGAVPEAEVRTAEQAVAAARARLAAAEARLRATSLESRDTRVLAPISGVVETRQVAGGERVSRGATLFTVVRSDALELAAAVPARRANGLRPGQPVRFGADGHSFEGRIARVSPTVDPASRALTVYVNVPNPGGALKGGTFATGRIIRQVIQGALVVPTAALRRTEAGDPYVYKIEQDILAHIPVTLGIVDEAGGSAQVTDGLQEGDRVVVGNVGMLGDGMRVQVIGGDRPAGASARPQRSRSP
ncbi:MAG: efflux RND transporter periplasmic adaptor subunit [Gemmatimonadetes bacterium]|nr:efflux RND transporter periplasmic adaptor subunit [Gemmatimonadota bacterium]